MSAERTDSNNDQSGTATLIPETQQRPKPATHPASTKPKHLPPYHVILLDDEDHTHEYVIEMMRSLFGYPPERGYSIAKEVDTHRKAVVFTTHKELAELKRDQIHAFGTDIRVATCVGSMSACIVAAE
jgi:ATP-dependent Clp protease adaptor protein ClpS